MGDRTEDPARDVLGVFVARLLLDRLVGLAEAAYDDLPDTEREALRAAYTRALKEGLLDDASLVDGQLQRPAVPRPRRGEPAPPAPVARARAPSGVTLTRRELEVLELVAEGHSNGEIGRRLFISTKTVSVHVSHVLAKLGAASRTQAVAIARRLGILAA